MSNNAYHAQLMQNYYCAEQVWLERREFETVLYPTEKREWEAVNPRPTLKMFLTGGRLR